MVIPGKIHCVLRQVWFLGWKPSQHELTWKRTAEKAKKEKEQKTEKKNKHRGPELMMLAMYNLFLEFTHLWNFFYDV